MNNVIVNSQEIPQPLWSDFAVYFAQKVLDIINRDNWELSILFCDDKTITNLNNQYRNKNEPTDILSFNLGETITDPSENGEKTTYLAGDIVISLETLRENALYFKISEDEELRRLIIHGILHLDGMNHDSINSDEPMLLLQEEILNKLKNERIITAGGNK